VREPGPLRHTRGVAVELSAWQNEPGPGESLAGKLGHAVVSAAAADGAPGDRGTGMRLVVGGRPPTAVRELLCAREHRRDIPSRRLPAVRVDALNIATKAGSGRVSSEAARRWILC
jgi:hypothetical protein